MINLKDNPISCCYVLIECKNSKRTKQIGSFFNYDLTE